MSPEPEPSATTPTAVINMTASAHIDPFAQRAVRGDVDWRIWERALVMLWSVALLCGLCWALGLMTLNMKPLTARAAGPVSGLSTVDLSGRWKGQPMGYLDPAKVCGVKGCELTLDIVHCGEKWCGIRVEKADKCGGQALSLAAKKAADAQINPVFDGKLELVDGTQPYVIEAVLRAGADEAPPQLTMTGDTGPELMMMRRSFPFHAVMARVGDAVCKMEKPAV